MSLREADHQPRPNLSIALRLKAPMCKQCRADLTISAFRREETHDVTGTDCVVSIPRVEGIYMLTRPTTKDRE